MRSETKRKLRLFLSREVAIEYKACLYFSCIVFFYAAWLLLRGSFWAGIGVLFEMVLTAYFIGYIQVYFMENFDEAEAIGKKEALRGIGCTGLYVLASFVLNWFGREGLATALFAGYMLLVYFCVFLCNKIKRDIDTRKLNRMLTEFKKGER